MDAIWTLIEVVCVLGGMGLAGMVYDAIARRVRGEA